MYDLTELFFYRPVFMVEILLAMHLFLFRLRKKKLYPLRVTLSCLLLIGLSFAYPLASYSSWYISIMFLAMFLLATFSLFFIYDVQKRYIVFCAITAYTVQHFSHEIYNLIVNAFSLVTSGTIGLYGNNLVDFSKLNGGSIGLLSLYILSYAICYLGTYLIFQKKIGKEVVEINNLSLLLVSGSILFVDILLNATVVYITEGYSRIYALVSSIYNILCCLMVLYIQYSLINTKKLESELLVTAKLLKLSEEQFHENKENMNLINLKCHDLKHQIRAYGEKGSINPSTAKEIEGMISIYDSKVKTGNEALDLILTEKSLKCQKNDIKLTCMADCSKLSFIADEDLYSLFGNAIDNAIEAVMKIQEKDKRNINVIVRNINRFVSILVENYYDGTIDLDKDGFPITTKGDKDYHGYGLRSIQMIVGKYSGDLKIEAKKDVFDLSVMFVVPDAAEAKKA